MQFSTYTLIATLGTASSVLAAGPQALVFAYQGPACKTPLTTSTIILANSNVGCGVTLNPTTGGANVFGSGCTTFFYTDKECKNNFFGNGNTVPDSSCYTGVGSYSVKCPNS